MREINGIEFPVALERDRTDLSGAGIAMGSDHASHFKLADDFAAPLARARKVSRFIPERS